MNLIGLVSMFPANLHATAVDGVLLVCSDTRHQELLQCITNITTETRQA